MKERDGEKGLISGRQIGFGLRDRPVFSPSQWEKLVTAGTRWSNVFSDLVCALYFKRSRTVFKAHDWPRESFLFIFTNCTAPVLLKAFCFFIKSFVISRFSRIHGTLVLRDYVDPCFFFAFHVFYAGAGVKLKDTNASKTAPYSAQVPCT